MQLYHTAGSHPPHCARHSQAANGWLSCFLMHIHYPAFCTVFYLSPFASCAVDNWKCRGWEHDTFVGGRLLSSLPAFFVDEKGRPKLRRVQFLTLQIHWQRLVSAKVIYGYLIHSASKRIFMRTLIILKLTPFIIQTMEVGKWFETIMYIHAPKSKEILSLIRITELLLK